MSAFLALSSLDSTPTFALFALIDAAAKGLVLLAASGAVALALRRRAAALRHLVWLLGLAGLLLLPVASAMLPAWRVPVPGLAMFVPGDIENDEALEVIATGHVGFRPTPKPAGQLPLRPGDRQEAVRRSEGEGPVAASTKASAPVAVPWPEIHWTVWVLLGWALGALAVMTPLVAAVTHVWYAARQATPLRDRVWLALTRQPGESPTRKVELLQSDRPVVPMTWGLLRHWILLPAEADSWSEDRRRLVLVHELAHVQRRDCLTQMVAHVACAAHWFNPLVWLAAQRLRVERERACDDYVLRRGFLGSDYAEHLVSIARGLQTLGCAAIGAVTMARRARIEQRVTEILDPSRRRDGLPRSVAAAALALTVCVLVPLGAIRPAPAETELDEQAAPAVLVRDELTAAQSAPAPPKPTRRYRFRFPAYSLREEPQRVKPRTLSQRNPDPRQAVVFGRPIRWWCSHWAGKENTSCAGMEERDELVRFRVTAPGRRRVWVKYLDVPIDPQRYPIAVFTYRAKNTKLEARRYALYLDDGSGPDYGGLMAFVHEAIVADGEAHTMTYDLRTMEPAGDIIGVAVGVACNTEGPAYLDLLDLRFEATGASELPAPAEGESIVVTAVDSEGRRLAGAEVTVDAERRNWAKSSLTDAQGTARVVPYRTQSGRHMVRVSKPGMLPVEIRGLPPQDEPIVATLEPAGVFAGAVIDEDGRPLPEAAVHIHVQHQSSAGLWTRRDAVVMSDEDGKWRTPALPRAASWAYVALAHARHGSGPSARYHLACSELLSGVAALRIVPERSTLRGTVVDEQGGPIASATVTALASGKSTKSGTDGTFEIGLAAAGEQLLISSDTHAPVLFHMRANDLTPGEARAVRLTDGEPIRGQVLDPAGQPVAGATVEMRDWRAPRVPLLSTKSDGDGRFEWLHAPAGPLTVEVKLDGFLPAVESLSRRAQGYTITLTPVPKKTKDGGPPDRRTPGYDPFRIFRQRSDATMPGRSGELSCASEGIAA